MRDKGSHTLTCMLCHAIGYGYIKECACVSASSSTAKNTPLHLDSQRLTSTTGHLKGVGARQDPTYTHYYNRYHSVYFGVAHAFFLRLAAPGAAGGPKERRYARRASLALFTRRLAPIPELPFRRRCCRRFFPGPISHATACIINNKKSYASRLAPRSPSSGAKDDESPPS